MRKITFILLIFSVCGYAQVGINTTSPQGILHIDGKKDNNPATAPTAAQQTNDFVIKNDGKVGVGTTTPQINLDITSKSATSTVTTPDGVLIPKVSLTRLKQIDDNVDLQYGNLVYVNDVSGIRDVTTEYVVFPGFYFWNNTYWSKILTFDSNFGINTHSNIYSAASPDINRTVKCGRFEFALEDFTTPYIYARLNRNPGVNVRIKASLQNERSGAYNYTNRSVDFTPTNWNAYQQFNNFELVDRNYIALYTTYPGDPNFYRAEFFKANGVWTVVCSQF